MKRPRRLVIGITLGDCNGIGPEIALRAAYRRHDAGSACFVLIGSTSILNTHAAQLGLHSPPSWRPGMPVPAARVVGWDPAPAITPRLAPGKCRADAGIAAAAWIKAAVRAALRGDLDAIVTAPVNKAGLALAGVDYRGHTEMIAALTHAKRYAMMLTGGPLRVVLATRHVRLADVPRALTRRAVIDAVTLAADAVRWFGSGARTVGVCALNPHAGDGGVLGCEERDIIAPAIAALRRRGVPVRGPIPGDVIFHQAIHGAYGAVVAMYHDQGLAPLKMIAFDTGVNLTLGLPIIRTSPDHGTAYDIAGRGKADIGSMAAAIRAALTLARRSNPWRWSAGGFRS